MSEEVESGGNRMGLLTIRVMEILAVWSGIALILSLVLVTMMRHGQRERDRVSKIEMRKARRYGLSLPVYIHAPIQKDFLTRNGRTCDISTTGIYFHTESDLKPGNEVNLTITVPIEITRGSDVFINVTGKVVRVKDCPELNDMTTGVAVTIDHYEILHSDLASPQDNLKNPVTSVRH
jgi:hypothetical protein